MSSNRPRLKDSLRTYDGNPPKKSNRRALLWLLSIMMILIIIIYFIFNQYTQIRNAYQEHIYHPDLLPEAVETVEENQEIYTKLILGLNQIERDQQQMENATWAILAVVNSSEREQSLFYFPTNILLEGSNGQVYLNNYIEEGVYGLTNQISEYLEIPIPFVTTVKLSQTRDIVEEIGTVDIIMYQDVMTEENQYFANRVYELSGLQFNNLINETNNDTAPDLIQRQQELTMQLFENITTWQRILQLPDILTQSEYVIHANLPFNRYRDYLWIDEEQQTIVKYFDLFDPQQEVINDEVFYVMTEEDWLFFRTEISEAIQEYTSE